MIFVDTNVLMYAVGRPHPLRKEARSFFERSMAKTGTRLCTSAEVLQELVHAYLPVQRVATLDAALALAESCIEVVFPIEEEDARLARALLERHPGLDARDLLHLATCRRHGVADLETYDRGLRAAFDRARR